jgi:hypothetical protein
MRIGFTGTRQGMTVAQAHALRDILASHGPVTLHHGDCIGADAQAHDIAVELGRAVVIHPPVIGGRDQRAWKTAPDVREAKPYLKRNKDIVRETELLIATPAEASEQHRSGTWSTSRCRRTRGQNKFSRVSSRCYCRCYRASRLCAITAKEPIRASTEIPAEPSISGTPHCQKLANVGPEAITVIVAARANLIPVCMFFPPRFYAALQSCAPKSMLTKQRVNLVRRLRLQAGGLEGRDHRRPCPSGLTTARRCSTSAAPGFRI